MRKDHNIIKSIATTYGLDTALQLQGLPYFEVPKDYQKYIQEGEPESLDTDRKNYTENARKALEISKLAKDVLPFNRFVIFGKPFNYAIITMTVEEGMPKWKVTLPLTDLIGSTIPEQYKGYLITIHLDHIKDNEDGSFMSAIDVKLLRSGTSDINEFELGREVSKSVKFNKGNMIKITASILYLLTYFMWADSRHLVSVVGGNASKLAKNKSKNQKKPWARNDLPKYIYLDSHDEHMHPQTGSAENHLKVGHNRRSHWRTMTHERFKNHPLYNIPMRIKSSWVGPDCWVSNNKTYTVHEVKNG